MKQCLLACLVLAGCGGNDEGEFTCAQSDRTGTYLVHYAERANGTCGAWPDEVVRLDGSGEINSNCQLTEPNEWSDGNCKFSTSVECYSPDNGVTVQITAITTQQDDSADALTGLMMLTVSQGGDSCRSTYDVSANRQ